MNSTIPQTSRTSDTVYNVTNSRITTIPGKGRGLVAERACPPGTPLLVCYKPYIAILNNASLEENCFECFLKESLSSTPQCPPEDYMFAAGSDLATRSSNPDRIEVTLKHCVGCKVVKYCSKQCQTTSWGRFHKEECKIFKRIKTAGKGVLPTETRTLVCLMTQVKRTKSETMPDTRLADCMDLQFHRIDEESETGKDVGLKAKMACLQTGLTSPRDEGVARKLCCILRVNAFQLIDHNEKDIGLLFDPKLSLANHSCVPNAFISVDGREATLRALKRIEKDEEICISYLESTTSWHNRKGVLADKYSFDCICPRCKDDEACTQLYHHSLDTLRRSSPLDLQLFPLQATSNIKQETYQSNLFSTGDRREFCKNISTLLASSKLRDNPTMAANYPIGDALQLIYNWSLAASPPSHAVAALLLMHKVTQLDPIRYPSHIHPNRAAGYFALATILPTVIPSGVPEPDNFAVLLSKIAPSTTSTVREVQERGLEAQMALLLITRHYGTLCHGKDSRFMNMVEDEYRAFADYVTVMTMRGMQVSMDWRCLLERGLKGSGPMGDGVMGDGAGVASKLLGRLRELGNLENVRACLEAIGNGEVQV